jgi:hypothetical protein
LEVESIEYIHDHCPFGILNIYSRVYAKKERFRNRLNKAEVRHSLHQLKCQEIIGKVYALSFLRKKNDSWFLNSILQVPIPLNSCINLEQSWINNVSDESTAL